MSNDNDRVLRVSIVTPFKIAYEGQVSSLIVPGELGYLGVLVNHAPLIADLVPGKIIVRDTSNRTSIFHSAGKGIIEVLENNVNILVDSIESSI
ncbi:MAG: F0F1 ATP synthase subunit epsilon [Candidatus Omnitrophota bacterium]